MKKFMLSCMAGILTLSMTSSVLAVENQVYTDKNMMKQLELNNIQVLHENNQVLYSKEMVAENSADVEATIQLFDLMPETADALRDYSEKCRNGELELKNLSVVTSDNPLRANSSKEYTGYKNKKYKEEIIKLTPGGATREVEFLEKTRAEKFLKGLATAAALIIIDKGSEKVMGPSEIPLSSILSSLPTAQEQAKAGTMFVSSHETSLTQKFTYIKQDDGQFAFGSRTAEGTQYFSGRIALKEGRDLRFTMPTKRYKTRSYDTPDKAAFVSYVNGGVVESMDCYKLEFKDKDTNKTYVETFASCDR